MSTVVYQIVEHDGGWAYRAKGAYSETYRSRDAARDAARRAANEQQQSGDSETIEYEDENGRWKTERANGDDRPSTVVIE